MNHVTLHPVRLVLSPTQEAQGALALPASSYVGVPRCGCGRCSSSRLVAALQHTQQQHIASMASTSNLYVPGGMTHPWPPHGVSARCAVIALFIVIYGVISIISLIHAVTPPPPSAHPSWMHPADGLTLTTGQGRTSAFHVAYLPQQTSTSWLNKVSCFHQISQRQVWLFALLADGRIMLAGHSRGIPPLMLLVCSSSAAADTTANFSSSEMPCMPITSPTSCCNFDSS